MAEVNLPGNQLYSENKEKEKLKPVISKSAIVSVKKPALERLKEMIASQDIINNIILPGIGNMIIDSLEGIFFKTHNRRFQNPYPYQYQDPRYQYGGYGYGYNYSQYYQPQQQVIPEPVQNKPDYRNIILRTQQDAEAVIRQMKGRIIEFGSCSVAELFDLIQVPGEYTDNNWGWRNPNEIGIRRVANGFLILVPDAMPL